MTNVWVEQDKASQEKYNPASDSLLTIPEECNVQT
jgi:hypothetical protein